MLHAIRAKEVGPFTAVDLDLSTIDGPLVAVTGDNGNGKTFLLELVPAAFWRTFSPASKRKLNKAFHNKDSFIEVSATYAKTFTIRQTADDSLVTGDSNLPVEGTESAKKRAFAAWSPKNLPAKNVFFASEFIAQQSGGFVELERAERKDVFLKLLGHEHLKEKMTRANKLADEKGKEASGIASRLVELVGDQTSTSIQKKATDDLAQAIADEARVEDDRAFRAKEFEVATERAREIDTIDALREKHATLDKSIADLETEIARTRASIERYEAVIAGHDHAALERLKAQLDLEIQQAHDIDKSRIQRNAIDKEVTDATVDEKNTYADLARAIMATNDPIDDDTFALIEATAGAARGYLGAAERRIDMLKREAEQAEIDWRIANNRAKAAGAAVTRHKPTADRRAEVDAAVASLPDLEAAAATAQTAVDDLAAELDALRGAQIVGADGRIAALRTGLEKIADDADKGVDDGNKLGDIASTTLKADDESARVSRETPPKIAAMLPRIAQAKGGLTKASNDLDAARKVAALADQVAAAEGEVERAIDEGARASEDAANIARMGTETKAQLADIQGREEGLRLAVAEADAARQAAVKRREEAAGATARTELLKAAHQAAARRLEAACAAQAAAPPIAVPPDVAATRGIVEMAQEAARDAAVAVASLAVERRNNDVIVDRLATATAEKEALRPVPTGFDPRPDLEHLKAMAAAGDTNSRAAQAEVGRARGALDAAIKLAERADQLERERAQAEEELADWARLALDIDAIRMLEIDAAGPDTNELANDFLRVCYGPRFMIEIRTVRMSSDGDKEIDGFDVMVTDSETGRTEDVSTYSGGEKVMIGEAIHLAIMTRACRTSGSVKPTLIRDESGAALSPERAPGYIQMLRRAAELTGADKILFVSHSKEMNALADARIIVAKGTVTVEGRAA